MESIKIVGSCRMRELTVCSNEVGNLKSRLDWVECQISTSSNADNNPTASWTCSLEAKVYRRTLSRSSRVGGVGLNGELKVSCKFAETVDNSNAGISIVVFMISCVGGQD